MIRYLAIFLAGVIAVPVSAAEPFPGFEEVVIDPEIGKVCYAVCIADVDGDGINDIVAVSEKDVFWYRAPDWKKHPISIGQTPPDNVCIVPHDIDGDGKVDFALGAGWLGRHTGSIHWLKRKDSLDEPWHVYTIGAESWLHRMRWADVLGTGTPQLTISPLNATQGPGVRVMAFEVPADPTRDRWPSTILNTELNRMHNHWHSELLPEGSTLTASSEGVFQIDRKDDDFIATRLGAGAPHEDKNLSGAGEIKIGRLKNGSHFLCTVEPMHGTILAVYTPPEKPGDLWARHVIDEGFQRGHALWTADLDGDGSDEIIFGHSDTPHVPGVNIYTCRGDDPTRWEKHVIDAGGMATEDLVVGDVTGDGKPDIIAGGRQTRNVKLYINRESSSDQ